MGHSPKLLRLELYHVLGVNSKSYTGNLQSQIFSPPRGSIWRCKITFLCFRLISPFILDFRALECISR